ncbi:vacuolar sorting protein [Moesziomyces antarcticus T-34]|uniref:Vacuolar sorting protein n=1 Tax=Pseudozyma antarctica (strain T-34) TaxID=1151754 RepID=M9LZ44_PSEA3|nr:vacuolar sorting protein [Moesziomyces antarcticus T-34]
MDHAVVQRWLRSVLGPYNDRDRVYADVDRALIAVSSLSPKTEVFTFNDGRTQLLLTLEGTVPVEFRNTTYNIPVAYWIPRDYPREPPMAFVAPTPDMAIRKGPNVDPSGEIGGNYIARWRSKPEACNLLDLIHDCQHMFGREPPVYAKPKPTPVYATAASSQQRSQPSTPQQGSSANPLAQRPGPSLPASPRSPQVVGSPSFETRQKPPPPPPGPDSAHHDHPQGSFTPQRPPKPSSSMGFDRGGFHSPRNSSSHFDPHQSPAPLPALQTQSPHTFSHPPSARPDVNRRASGGAYGPGAYQAPFGAPSPQAHFAPADRPQPRIESSHSPVSPSHRPAYAEGRPYAYGHQSTPQQHPPTRAQTYPYPTQEPHPSHTQHDNEPAQAGVRLPVTQGYAQPGLPHANGGGPPPVPGPHPYASASASQAPNPAAAGVADRNGVPARPAATPRPKSVNLLDDEDSALGLSDTRGQANGIALAGGPTSAGSSAPPPPRPINPELLALHERVYVKIDQRLVTLSSTLQASNQRLEVLSSDLDRGLPAIEDEMSRLKAVRDVCKITGDRLQGSVDEITESVRSIHARDDPDPDSMVLATSIVGNQLVDLVAEDNAIEDTLYHLGRALNAERIDLDRFLKQTRMLAREQFMKRALAHKISEGMRWS